MMVYEVLAICIVVSAYTIWRRKSASNAYIETAKRIDNFFENENLSFDAKSVLCMSLKDSLSYFDVFHSAWVVLTISMNKKATGTRKKNREIVQNLQRGMTEEDIKEFSKLMLLTKLVNFKLMPLTQLTIGILMTVIFGITLAWKTVLSSSQTAPIETAKKYYRNLRIVYAGH